ncbi:MAG: hypothetical protein JEY99_14270 [Spirochaetales bacterium]|nr:hypothetical protein [Spirochaetales bacterium]
MKRLNFRLIKSGIDKIILPLIIITFLTACPIGGGSILPGSGGTGTPGLVESYFWGSWVRMDGVNEEWYIRFDSHHQR